MEIGQPDHMWGGNLKYNDQEQERWVEASTHGYVDKLREQYNHEPQTKPQCSSHRTHTTTYCTAAHDTILPGEIAQLDKDNVKIIQKKIRYVSILWQGG